MLPNILLKSIEKAVNEVDLVDKNQLERLLEPYFNDSTTRFIYPGAVSRKLKISIDQSFKLLNVLEKEGFLESVFEFRCPDDGHRRLFKGIKYINLPNEIVCGECYESFVVRDYLFVIYEVKNES